MSACEVCWERAFIIARTKGIHQVEAYQQLIKEAPEDVHATTVALDQG